MGLFNILWTWWLGLGWVEILFMILCDLLDLCKTSLRCFDIFRQPRHCLNIPSHGTSFFYDVSAVELFVIEKKKKKILWWFFGDSLLLCCWIDLAFRVLLIRPMACLLVVCLSCSINITCDATNILVPLVESICKWLNYRLFNPFHIDSLMFNELLLSKFHCLDIANYFFLPRNAPDEYWLIWIQC